MNDEIDALRAEHAEYMRQNNLRFRQFESALADAVNGKAKVDAELDALRKFHDFFTDRGEALFWKFGMDAIDAYNSASKARIISK